MLNGVLAQRSLNAILSALLHIVLYKEIVGILQLLFRMPEYAA